MKHIKTIALVAHDNRKKDLLEWVKWNAVSLIDNDLVCTGTTGKMVREVLKETVSHEPSMTLLRSGPLGGDQQLGSMIVNGEIDVMVFFWDPLSSQPHDSDVKALLRIAVLYDVVVACSRSTADFVMTSDLMSKTYTPHPRDFSEYENRFNTEETQK